jgi:IS1 family transposase
VIEIDEICLRKSPSLWLWVAISREVGQVLGFAVGDRSDAELAWLWRDVKESYQSVPVCTEGWGAYGRFFSGRNQAHTVCAKGSGGTSRSEAGNTRWRQRQSGLVRRSCGVSRRIVDDIAERFMILAEQHNRHSIRLYQRRERCPKTTYSSP